MLWKYFHSILNPCNLLWPTSSLLFVSVSHRSHCELIDDEQVFKFPSSKVFRNIKRNYLFNKEKQTNKSIQFIDNLYLNVLCIRLQQFYEFIESFQLALIGNLYNIASTYCFDHKWIGSDLIYYTSFLIVRVYCFFLKTHYLKYIQTIGVFQSKI